MVGEACLFPESNDLESAGNFMISSMTTKEGGAEVALPRHFYRYSPQSFLDPTNVTLQLAPDWAVGGHWLATMQSPLRIVSLLI